MSVMGNVTTLPAGLVPSLDLDFINQRYRVNGQEMSFADVITFTRASAAAYYDSTGKMQMASANAPRLGFDPASGESVGLVLEDQRTNTFLHSANLTLMNLNAGATWDADPVMGPDGELTARVLNMAGPAASGVYRTNAANSTSQQAWSVHAKPISGNGIVRLQLGGAAYSTTRSVDFDLINGKVVASSGATGFIFKHRFGGWYRIGLTAPVDNAASPVHNVTIYAGDTTAKSFAVAGGQMETGLDVSSTIPTGSAAVTRAGDVGLMEAISSWFRAGAGAVYVDADSRTRSKGGTFGVSLGADSKNYIGLAYTAVAGPSNMVYARSGDAGPTIGPAGAAAHIRQIMSWDAQTVSTALNGGEVFSAAAPAGWPINATSLRFGSSHFSSAIAPMHLRRLQFYSQGLTAATLKELTR
ncbi:hypothetical protein ACIPK7_05300 [Pseudomonas sp. NPDC086581]|uniref:phage head spike fiber domain-containing protein n=1 Tax=Pseudomonas sp. NPDC086581 TaxID=3364432 RepID=UPI0038213233